MPSRETLEKEANQVASKPSPLLLQISRDSEKKPSNDASWMNDDSDSEVDTDEEDDYDNDSEEVDVNDSEVITGDYDSNAIFVDVTLEADQINNLNLELLSDINDNNKENANDAANAGDNFFSFLFKYTHHAPCIFTFPF